MSKPNYSVQLCLAVAFLFGVIVRGFLNLEDKIMIFIVAIGFLGFTIYNFYLEEKKE